jgi:1,4-alpha-glucan branching enzyme
VVEIIAGNASLLTAEDIYLFREGTHTRMHRKLGAHCCSIGGKTGTMFSVWAPNATGVSVIGDFNDWNPAAHPLHRRDADTGIWEGFVAGVGHGAAYKYRVTGARGYCADKGDPFARACECPPATASRVWQAEYRWGDDAWMRGRSMRNSLEAPLSIYELHLGSWRRAAGHGDRLPTYREVADWLPGYVAELGFTHVEFMPLTEHPFYGSWGYQCTGYFAPSARYGSPEDLKFLIDTLHRHGIGVILDWVPSHFPADEHGLVYFDGTHLYEHADRRKGFHPEWNSWIFNYGRNEVRAFLGSSAHYWLEEFHADGLRVDAVASMLYLDYGRLEGEWLANEFGGRENLEAVAFLRQLSESVYADFPAVQMIAEESTAWPGVSRPTTAGGLGFGLKWNMGWMHDTLQYMQRDFIHRRYHHDELTFSFWYAFSENYLLPLSHDEVVYGKGSLLGRMPGDEWQQFAGLRALYGYMWAHPGKKLLFMGGEFAQRSEWNHDSSLDWHLAGDRLHRGVARWIADLNRALCLHPALHADDCRASGFEMAAPEQDAESSVVAFLRRSGAEWVLVLANFTPTPRWNYRVPVPVGGYWREILNSDAVDYGGSGQGNMGGVLAAPIAMGGRPHLLTVTLPPLAVVMFRPTELPDDSRPGAPL